MTAVKRRIPVQNRALAKVAFVLDAAARVLEEDGLDGYNTNAIARRAGISVGTLYQYFSSKDEITAELITRRHQGIVAAQQKILADTANASARSAITTALESMIALQKNSMRLGRILEMEEYRLPATPETRRVEREIDSLNRALLQRYVDPQACTPRELDNASKDMVCMVRAMLEAAAFNGMLGEPDLLARLERAVWGYLAPLMRAPQRAAASRAGGKSTGLRQQARRV